MNRKIAHALLLAGLGANLLIGAQLYFQAAQASERDDVYSNISLFTHVLEKVREEYVEGTDLTYKKLIYGALQGMLNTLDPHSEFMEPEQHQELRKDTQGEFGGIGIVVSKRNGFLTVVSPIEGTPGFEAGFHSGDRIIRIDGETTENFSLEDAVKRLRGKPGTKVQVTIYRPSTEETKQKEVERAIIQVRTVKDIHGEDQFPLLSDDVGYVRVSQFGEKTSGELREALKDLEEKGMTSLILDLRHNPGGLLDQAVEVCETFLPSGQLVVSTRGRGGQVLARHKAGYRSPYLDVPMVVLVNQGSASASEIVAGSLQDVGRAIVLGEKTFGKGSVQSVLPLPDGSALRLTTAKYYTPSEEVIHEKGIAPDILVPMTPQEEQALYYKRAPGGLESLPEEERARVEEVNDTQLDRAIDLLTGVKIFSQRHRQPAVKAVAEK